MKRKLVHQFNGSLSLEWLGEFLGVFDRSTLPPRTIHKLSTELSTMTNAQNVGIERVCGLYKSYPHFFRVFYFTRDRLIK